LDFPNKESASGPVEARLEGVVERAIQTVRILPEFESIRIGYIAEGDCSGYFDPAKIERVMVNLLFNTPARPSTH
jgi:signal transduction histidine kinase